MKPLFRLITGVGKCIDGFYARGLLRGPTYGDAEAVELRAALQAGEWQAAQTALAKHPKDWARRFFLVSVAAEWDREPAWLAEWTSEQPGSTEAQLVAGAARTHLAWAARGAGYAQTVSEEGARLFYERLQTAMETLTRATKLSPQDPTPWARLLIVGRGLGLPKGKVNRYFEGAVAADPQHYHAHHELLQYKCAKWHGSNDEMWAFAREAVEAAPAGSPVCSLIPTAHMEHCHNLASDDGVTDPDRVEREYWSKAHVMKTIIDAYRKMQSSSVPLSPDRLAAFNDFAYGLWRCGATILAAEALQQLGNRLFDQPWGVMLFPAKTFRKARRECKVKG